MNDKQMYCIYAGLFCLQFGQIILNLFFNVYNCVFEGFIHATKEIEQ